MTPYETALNHLARNVYTRGIFKGDAPADPQRRGKSHFRVTYRPHDDTHTVRFHSTDIITCHANGDITLDARGWSDRPTTRSAFWEGLKLLEMGHLLTYPHGRTFRSAKHTVIRAPKGTYVYYDGMRFNAEGVLLTPPEPFQERRIDREEAATLKAELKASGFTDMYKILYATSPAVVTKHRYQSVHDLRGALTDNARAETWPDVITGYKWRGHGYSTSLLPSTACWSAIMADLKRHMHETTDTDITIL